MYHKVHGIWPALLDRKKHNWRTDETKDKGDNPDSVMKWFNVGFHVIGIGWVFDEETVIHFSDCMSKVNHVAPFKSVCEISDSYRNKKIMAIIGFV